ncbi:GNAT family N-acetyltransferase [Opitutus terrae]|uniref:GCN5-related N-acetyltransferase n=1 Tax=Opitutus terrae (strain DSM 11246 / JCM 15787 / PB90-1) TaxID=452637 RepID=B1ZQF8_OPITP|nr:GNAT family N-acetyltransferase [Opitutus terrae]ACB73638.1 GCN5-related N-acetyltransferase [Opitutus terrae PB90-1]
MPAIEIVPVPTDPPLCMAGVKALWRQHSRFLGFFPDGAFTDYARRGQILAAMAPDGLLAYLIYRISDDRAVIVHLCTAERARGAGVARSLVNELKKITQAKNLRGIGLSCRVDFPANTLWPRLGFYAVHERAGRSKDGRMLTYWWLDHGLPDLFSFAATVTEASRIVAAIDANIFFDLISERDQGDESRALVADWLQSEIDLCIADEIYHEIQRHDDDHERTRCRQRCSQFRILSSSDEKRTVTQREIAAIMGLGNSEREKSDRSHLIKAAAAGADVFLTRDDELLRYADEVHQRLGLEILLPAELVGRIDEIRRIAAYQPAKLAGSRIDCRRCKAEEIDRLPERLCATHRGETPGDFRRKLRSLIAYPDRADVFVITDAGEVLALLAFSRTEPGVLEVPVIRVLPGGLSRTLDRHLVLRSVQVAVEATLGWVRVTDSFVTPEIESALTELCFIRIRGHHARCTLRAHGTLDEVLPRISRLDGANAAEAAVFKTEIDRLRGEPTKLGSELERIFWPVKIFESGIPTFGVAIHPKWAQHFFDEAMARQELFGAEPFLALNREHIYYRSANRCGLRAPARLLWYVTKDGDFEGTMAIRACSRLVEIDIGRPKELYRRYQRLGVYRWENVYETADRSLDTEIMALRFMDTEVFNRPVTLAEAKQLGVRANFESPVRIDEGIFRQIYLLGLGQAVIAS